jgi:cell division protein FtsI (penicillin-binding protein 3)
MLDTVSTKRLKWLLWIMLLWVSTIFVRLVWLQIVRHDDLVKQAEQQQQKTVEVQALRGTIFDRTGQPLAKTLPAESICINPLKIPDPTVAADLMARILDLDRTSLLKKIVAAKARRNGFMWVKRKVTPDEANRVRSLKLDWVEFREDTRRYYPHGRLAAHVLGSLGMTSREDVLEHGNAGVELSFDEELSGRPGLARVFNDVRQNAYDTVITRQPEPGTNLTLTIDPNLQYDAERALEAAVNEAHARMGSLVALNPYTGDVLAMANYPTYDPNLPPRPGEPESARSNLAVTTPFEPGSVFKVITLAAALETTNLTPDTLINCGNGTISLFGRVIHDHDRYSTLTMADVLAKSSNIGAIQIGLKVGDRRLYEYVRRFGFGRKTGIELPGESAGMLRKVQNWEPASIGSIAMGHEISATSIQLALAGAAVANGGLLVKPRLILKRQKPGFAPEMIPAEKPERIIAPETAIKMRQMMERVVLHGTGKKASLRGYTSGGKTGSAQIYDFKAHAYTHTYNASFLGFAPVANPQVLIAVTLVGTSGGGSGFGGVVAAPVFREVATSALRMLDVPKDLPDSGTALASAQSEKGSTNDLAIAGLSRIPGDLLDLEAKTLSQSPERNTAHQASAVRSGDDAARNSFAARGTSTNFAHRPDGGYSPAPVRTQAVSSVTTLPPAQGGSPVRRSHDALAEPSLDRRPFLDPQSVRSAKVPDFRGMTLSGVLEESAANGLPIEVVGEGMARDQNPPPGSALVPGTRVRVVFTR